MRRTEGEQTDGVSWFVDESTLRHHRQTLLPGVGVEGQARLMAGHAVIVGCGALGTVAAEALCRAGVGRLTIIDRDVVEWTNLQRQTLFGEADARAGVPKAEAAKRRLGEIDGGVRVRAVVEDFTPGMARGLWARLGVEDGAGGVVLLDCTDNFETRFLMNDLSVSSGVPYVYAGAVGTAGMCRAVLPLGGRWTATSCLRCVFDDAATAGAPTCDTAGVLGPAAGIAAMLQAGEAIKILLGRFDLVRRGLVSVDVWRSEGAVRETDMGAAEPLCACCGGREFEWLEGRRHALAVRLCGRNAVQIAGLAACFDEEDDGSVGGADLGRVGAALRAHGEVLASASLVRCTLRDERSEDGTAMEITVFADGRAVVKGTQDAGRARSLVARYVGA
jgi:molybdopterin/thiamine biosynthesis adenylyltransferase